MTHDKAENRPNSKNSRTSQNSAQNRTKIAQCMPGFKHSMKQKTADGLSETQFHSLTAGGAYITTVIVVSWFPL